MSRVSNRFYVTALEDGTTLHGNLVSDKPLVQAWNGENAIPSWTTVGNQPTIYLTLLSGNSMIESDSDYDEWFYNGTKLTFGNNGVSTGTYANMFQKTTKTITETVDGETINYIMPALKIIADLASSANLDVDTVVYKGACYLGGALVTFSCTAQIRISGMTANGYLGLIDFVGGVADIIEVGQTVTPYAILYDGSGNPVPKAEYAVVWTLDGVQKTGTTVSVDGVEYYALSVSEADVTDHAIAGCQFVKDSGTNNVYTAYAGIDDMQDPEYMYIQNGTNANAQSNGNAASLRNGETAWFTVWIGTRDNPAVKSDWQTATYKVQLLNSDGAIIGGGSVNYIPAADSEGYRTVEKYASDYSTESLRYKAHFGLHYDVVRTHGKNVTGIIIATQATQ